MANPSYQCLEPCQSGSKIGGLCGNYVRAKGNLCYRHRGNLKFTIGRQFMLRLGSVESLAAKYKVSTTEIEDVLRSESKKGKR